MIPDCPLSEPRITADSTACRLPSHRCVNVDRHESSDPAVVSDENECGRALMLYVGSRGLAARGCGARAWGGPRGRSVAPGAGAAGREPRRGRGRAHRDLAGGRPAGLPATRKVVTLLISRLGRPIAGAHLTLGADLRNRAFRRSVPTKKTTRPGIVFRRCYIASLRRHYRGSGSRGRRHVPTTAGRYGRPLSQAYPSSPCTRRRYGGRMSRSCSDPDRRSPPGAETPSATCILNLSWKQRRVKGFAHEQIVTSKIPKTVDSRSRTCYNAAYYWCIE